MASNASHSVSYRVTLRISHTKENESEGTFSHREKLENTDNELSNQTSMLNIERKEFFLPLVFVSTVKGKRNFSQLRVTQYLME